MIEDDKKQNSLQSLLIVMFSLLRRWRCLAAISLTIYLQVWHERYPKPCNRGDQENISWKAVHHSVRCLEFFKHVRILLDDQRKRPLGGKSGSQSSTSSSSSSQHAGEMSSLWSLSSCWFMVCSLHGHALTSKALSSNRDRTDSDRPEHFVVYTLRARRR